MDHFRGLLPPPPPPPPPSPPVLQHTALIFMRCSTAPFIGTFFSLRAIQALISTQGGACHLGFLCLYVPSVEFFLLVAAHASEGNCILNVYGIHGSRCVTRSITLPPLPKYLRIQVYHYYLLSTLRYCCLHCEKVTSGSVFADGAIYFASALLVSHMFWPYTCTYPHERHSNA